MDFLRQLLSPDVAGFLALFALFAPLALIPLHRYGRWWSKLLWMLGSQASWAFVALYAWVRELRYPQGLLAEFPLTDAVGWWTFVFPWVVYLLYRATHLPPHPPAPPPSPQ